MLYPGRELRPGAVNNVNKYSVNSIDNNTERHKMSGKKPKAAPTDEELLAQFDDIVENNSNDSEAPKSSDARAPSSAAGQQEEDLLAELNSLAVERPASRPHTPRPASSTNTPAARSSKRNSAAATPPTSSARSSEDKIPEQQTLPRKSTESSRSFHKSFTPATEAEPEPESEKNAAPAPTSEKQAQSSGGGWWGGIFATASAAVKQAEAAVKEIQKNEEAQRWAEQVKGNVGALRGLGGEIRSRALPTFTNILHTLAPPISSHERLQIHITHDFVGYPSLDPLIYQTFSRVMVQVEGGDLMVIQRGQESSRRRGSDVGFTGSSGSGWSDGPWWRQPTETRDLGAVKGLVEGTKLVKVSAVSYANDYFAPRGGVEEAAKQATEVLSESNPVRSSDIFLAIQAISQTSPEDMFGGAAQAQYDNNAAEVKEQPDELVSFAVYLYDPIHGITFQTISQTLPQKWVDWLDAPAPTSDSSQAPLPEEIANIINTGGVDPREWVAEWIEEVITLSVGVVAQRYVARRMGVGEGGIGRGKTPAHVVESGGGEAARAI